MTQPEIRTSRGARTLAIVLLGTAALLGLALYLAGERRKPDAPTSDAAVAADSGDEEPAGTPSPMADGRYLGPDGVVLRIPVDWRLDPGTSRQLWGTLRPKDARDRLPEIGVGSISSGGSPAQAMEALDDVFAEILPELTGESRPDGDALVTRGSGEIGRRQVVQVRWMRPAGDRVVVAWGLFEPSFPAPEQIVREIAGGMRVA